MTGKDKIAIIAVTIILLIIGIALDRDLLEQTTIRDVLVLPAFIVCTSLIFKKKNEKTEF